MLSPEEIALRKTGITASDLVDLCGVSPYADGGPAKVFARKHAEYTDEQTDEMAVGHRLEPVALELLAEKRKLTYVRGRTEQHAIFPWFMATPDALIMEGDRCVAVAEAKAVGRHMEHHWSDPDEAPPFLIVQCHAQMMVKRVRRAYVTALLGTEHRMYTIDYCEELATTLLSVAQDFYEKHFLTRIPPPPDGSDAAKAAIAAAWPKHDERLLPSTNALEAMVQDYLRAKVNSEQWHTRAEKIKQELEMQIGDAKGIDGRGWRATWTYQEGYHVDGYDVRPCRKFGIRMKKEQRGKAA